MDPVRRRTRFVETALLSLVALCATYPTFLETFRSMAFQTVPRDDYVPYLLHLVGQGGEVPGAPHAYRVLSVAVAIPLYHVLPTYRFTRLDGVDPAYLRATESLAFTSWLSLAALAVLVFRIARDRFGAGRPASAAVMLATPLFGHYVALEGVDPLAMLLIAAAYYWIERRFAFAVIVVLGAGFNEKVWIVACLLVAARVVAAGSLRPCRVHLAVCAVAILAYAGIAASFRASGSEKPSEPRPLVSNAPLTLWASFSGKGLSQNVLPVALCLAGCAWATRALRKDPPPAWTPWEVLVPLGLTLLGLAANVGYTLGRLVMHSLPVILPPLSLALEAAEAGSPTPLPGATDNRSPPTPKEGP